MTLGVLVLGLGNVLLGDEGLGVWVAEALRRGFQFPDGVSIMEGGTLGLDLLSWLDDVERLLVIDAVLRGRAPGTIVRLAGDEVPAALGLKMSPHQIGLHDLLAAARLMDREPPSIVLWGMEPERLGPGTGFSPVVAQALPRLLSHVVDEVTGWGLPAEPVTDIAAPPIWWQEPATSSAR